MTVEELKVLITAKTSGLQTEINKSKSQLKSLETTTKSVTSSMTNAFKAVGVAVAALGIGTAIKSSVKDAMTYEASLQQVNRTLGESSSAFSSWVESQATGFGIAKSDAIKYGMTFSNMVSGFSSGTAETAATTTKLLETSAIIASKTGRSVEDVMERIRSGMLGSTEAIEDLGIYTKVSAIEQTNAFKKMSNGTPWNQLDSKTSMAITSMAILEQATEKYGDTLSNTTATKMAVLSAELGNLKLSLGQAFLPIVNTIIPYLSQFVGWLQIAISYFSAFINAVFGIGNAAKQVKDKTAELDAKIGGSATNTEKIADEFGNAAGNAKKLKGALSGIDEINALPSQSADAAGGGVNVPKVTVPEITTPQITAPIIPTLDFSAIENAVAKLKETISFDNIIAAWEEVKTAFAPIGEKIGEGAKWLYDNILVPFAEWTIEDFVPAFLNALAGAGDLLNGALTALQPLAIWLWESFLQPIAEWTGGVIVDVLNTIGNALSKIGDWIANNKEVVSGFTGTVIAFFAAWKVTELLAFIQMSGGLVTAFKNITLAIQAATVAKLKDKLETMYLTALYAKDFIVSLAKGTAEIVKQIFQWGILTGAKIADAIKTGILAVATNVMAAAQAALNFVMSLNPITIVIIAIVALIAAIVLLWNKSEAFRNFVIGAWEKIKEVFNTVAAYFGKVFSDAWTNITKAFSGMEKFFGDLWNNIVKKFTDIGTKIGEAVGGAFKSVINFIIGMVEGYINGWFKLINGAVKIINKIPGVNIGKIEEVKFPRLARGGIVDSATMFMAGEAGKEVVMPLENNTGWITELASKLNANTTTNDRPVEVVLQIGSTQLGRVVIDSINKLQMQEGRILLQV